ncbi:MAG: PKD domain-containing protein, partial [Longimicrobiales bacterium]|nr:PKD domain-containing protein [Longimicrobiales bacterium]
PPNKVSSVGDLALNPSRIGYPNPLESSGGWGGGSDTWDIVDGLRTYSYWANGLAFIPCGLRQATIDFGTPQTFNEVVVWHHAPYHAPYTYNIQSWNGASWITVFSTINGNGRDYLKYPEGPNWWNYDTPTVNAFPAVTGSKVKFELLNCEGPLGWAYSHGWIYEVEVYLTNQDPAADAGTDQTVEGEGPGGSTVTLVGSGSTDPDGDPLTLAWTLAGTSIGSGPSPEVTLGLGTHTILLTVDDGKGGTATDEVVVSVVDTKPPTVNMTVAPTVLLTPNHKMVLVANHISASDVCCMASLLVEVASNEPVNGGGDGDTEPDWTVVDNGDGTVDVWVRAERAGSGGGRVYTITATATDCAGNSSRVVGIVTVPHDKKKK